MSPSGATESIIVTGASGGIGEQFARQLARCGRNLVLVARNERALSALASELTAKHPDVIVHTLACDLSTSDGVRVVGTFVADHELQVCGLINNAGFGSHGQFIDEDRASLSRQIQLNCATVVDLTHQFLPAMLQAGSGMIVNVASTAAFQPVPTMAVYGATKAFVLTFTEALWGETRTSGVRVLALCPGATDTGFFHATGKEFMTKGRQTPDAVVTTALHALGSRQPSVVSGRLNKLSATGYRVLPRGLLTRLSGRIVATR